MGRLRDPFAGRPWDQMVGRSKDVRGTSVKHAFKLTQQTLLVFKTW